MKNLRKKYIQIVDWLKFQDIKPSVTKRTKETVPIIKEIKYDDSVVISDSFQMDTDNYQTQGANNIPYSILTDSCNKTSSQINHSKSKRGRKKSNKSLKKLHIKEPVVIFTQPSHPSQYSLKNKENKDPIITEMTPATKKSIQNRTIPLNQQPTITRTQELRIKIVKNSELVTLTDSENIFWISGIVSSDISNLFC